MKSIIIQAFKNEYHPKQIRIFSTIPSDVAHLSLLRLCVHKENLDNYNGLINSRKHIHNVQNILDLVTKKKKNINVMCKVFLTIQYIYVWVWYHNLEPSSITGFCDHHIRLISHFNTSIPTKKNRTNIFFIT
jgi:hypothetical protein